jgi:hypothetical protein
MNKKSLLVPITIVLAISLVASPAYASLELVETSTEMIGDWTVTWDSSFEDPDYTVGETIDLIVNWEVSEGGSASFIGFGLKEVGKKKCNVGFTPCAKRGPVNGDLLGAAINQDGQVTLSFKFTNLHMGKNSDVAIGNAHFKLYLGFDLDGDGIEETTAGFGVNVHVEDPAEVLP